MFLKKFNLIFVLLLHGKPMSMTLHKCDLSRKVWTKEGNVGQVATYPWLGVLRVHLHEGKSVKIAVTGLLLIKHKYAIANADDIIKIPKQIIKEDSKAMFIASNGNPWFCKVKDYMTHPEYDFATMNTIALVELKTIQLEEYGDDDDQEFPVQPICWPTSNYNTSNQLYIVGFTDENKLLEKVIYKAQFIDKKLCDEFYNRAGEGVIVQNDIPASYLCAFAPNKKTNCVWDNGMVLASNSSGKWMVIGFGTRGPGCSAPARFVDLSRYLRWVDTATSDQYDIYRRSAFSEGFKKKSVKDFEEVPVHTLMMQGLRVSQSTKMFDDKYGPEFFRIDRIDSNAISISFNDTYEKQPGACTEYKSLVYKENMTIVIKRTALASAVFKVDSLERSPAYIWYNLTMESGAESFSGTPKEIIRPQTMHRRTTAGTKRPGWQPNRNLDVNYIKDTTYDMNVLNMNLYINLKFSRKAVLIYEVYGPLNVEMKKIHKDHYKDTNKKTFRFGNKHNEYAEFKHKSIINTWGDNSHYTKSSQRVDNVVSNALNVTENCVHKVEFAMFLVIILPVIVTCYLC